MSSDQPPPRNDDPQPLEPDYVEYMDESSTPHRDTGASNSPTDRQSIYPTSQTPSPYPHHGPAERIRIVVADRSQVPCCSGCGCIALLLGSLFLLANPGGIIGTLLLILAAAWISATLLRLAGISRISPAYVYAMAPLFLVAVNLLTRLWRGNYPFTAWHILGVTAIVYLFLFCARHLGRP